MGEEKIVELPQETMADFEDEINASFVTYKEGDIVKGTVVSVEEEEVILDMRSFSQGVIPESEYSDDPDFHAMDEIKVGDVLEAVVMYEDDQGRIVLSLRQARETESWTILKHAMEERRIYETKVKSVVPSGVVAYVEGIRGFIPASQLSLTYVEQEELESYVGKMLKVCVITVDENADKLVLSAKEVEKEEAAKTHEAKLNALQKGFITEGTVTRIESYGCFVEFGEDLTGLVHISQICNKFLKSPKEVVKLGRSESESVGRKCGKIRLSMKEAKISPRRRDDRENPEDEVSMEYTEEEATTSLAGLLKGIRLD